MPRPVRALPKHRSALPRDAVWRALATAHAGAPPTWEFGCFINRMVYFERPAAFSVEAHVRFSDAPDDPGIELRFSLDTVEHRDLGPGFRALREELRARLVALGYQAAPRPGSTLSETEGPRWDELELEYVVNCMNFRRLVDDGAQAAEHLQHLDRLLALCTEADAAGLN